MDHEDAYSIAFWNATYVKRKIWDAGRKASYFTNGLLLFRLWPEWNDHPTHPRWAGCGQHLTRMRAIADRAIMRHDALQMRKRKKFKG